MQHENSQTLTFIFPFQSQKPELVLYVVFLGVCFCLRYYFRSCFTTSWSLILVIFSHASFMLFRNHPFSRKSFMFTVSNVKLPTQVYKVFFLLFNLEKKEHKQIHIKIKSCTCKLSYLQEFGITYCFILRIMVQFLWHESQSFSFYT